MNAAELVAGLGAKLGFSLKLSEAGTCRVHFDDDTVDFEQSGDSLYIMADMGSASGREEAYGRLLTANCLGAEKRRRVYRTGCRARDFYSACDSARRHTL